MVPFIANYSTASIRQSYSKPHGLLLTTDPTQYLFLSLLRVRTGKDPLPECLLYDFYFITGTAMKFNNLITLSVINYGQNRTEFYYNWIQVLLSQVIYLSHQNTCQYGKICLRHHDILNYWMDLFKIYIFIKVMMRHWMQSHLFLIIPTQRIAFLTKN